MLLTLAALALTLPAPAAADAAAGSISGTVTDASTADPIEAVEVCAWRLDGEGLGCDYTGADGAYLITELESGEYEVEFWPGAGNHLPQWFDGKDSWTEADPVVVAGAPVSGIDAALKVGGAIEGTVTAADGGAPVGGVWVCAWRVEGDEVVGFEICDFTAADGSYSIGGLATGDYRIEFWTGETEADLASQFYDGAYLWDEADAVAVAAEATVSGIDAALEEGAKIEGTVRAAGSGATVPWTVVCALESVSGDPVGCTETSLGGAYALRPLPPGQYKVVFSPDLAALFGEGWWEEEDDGFETQYFDHQTTLAAAETIALAAGGSRGGVDADLSAPAPPPAATPSLPGPPLIAPLPRVRKCPRGMRKKKAGGKVSCVCRRGFRKKRVGKGKRAKVRCVKVRKRKQRRGKSRARRADRLAALGSPRCGLWCSGSVRPPSTSRGRG